MCAGCDFAEFAEEFSSRALKTPHCIQSRSTAPLFGYESYEKRKFPPEFRGVKWASAELGTCSWALKGRAFKSPCVLSANI